MSKPETTVPRDRIDAYVADRRWRDEHYKWRKRVSQHLPAIAARVFALRGSGYRGSGFHYSMEARLGKLLTAINNYDDTLAPHTPSVDRMALEFLLRDLVRAEFSARGWNFPDKPHPVFGRT